MVTHSSTLAWEFPWREDPGGLQSIGSDMTEPLSMHAQSQVWGGSLEADVPACMLREWHLLIWKEQLLAPQKKLVKKWSDIQGAWRTAREVKSGRVLMKAAMLSDVKGKSWVRKKSWLPHIPHSSCLLLNLVGSLKCKMSFCPYLFCIAIPSWYAKSYHIFSWVPFFFFFQKFRRLIWNTGNLLALLIGLHKIQSSK